MKIRSSLLIIKTDDLLARLNPYVQLHYHMFMVCSSETNVFLINLAQMFHWLCLDHHQHLQY